MDRREITIRPYEPADEDAVVDLWARCGLVVPSNNPRADIARKMAADPQKFLVAVDRGAIVGTVMAGYDGHRGWINYLAVDPGRRREGIGKALVAAAEELLLQAGCPKINLQVRAANAGVIEFYERIGFTTEDRVSMGKRLVDDSPD
ncbi:MAG: GNAT family acetyltransferase [Planctomycetota bacterium]|jgi:ribosomal protein S18 acetylase RimI-like enzyme